MISKPIDSITKEDIDALVSNEVCENRTLDYKETLPGNSDGEKYEFLADVSSFANSSGGDILYGVREKREEGRQTGIPEAAVGLNGITADTAIQRLDAIMRDGIAPRIGNVQIVSVPGFENAPILLVRIPKSWLSPHMIVKRESRFYSRNNAGKYPLDVAEIRSAFALSESLPDKIRRFRDDRIAKIVADETPVKLSGTPRLILHILPVAALDPTTRINPAALDARYLVPIYSIGYNSRLNFDGLVNFNPVAQTPFCRSYVQLFRTGAIEAANASLIPQDEKRKFIAGNHFEQQLISALSAYLKVEEELQLQPPIFVMVTLLAVMGYRIYSGPFSDENDPIDRENLFLPDILVEDYEVDASKLLQPAFDSLWQACGFTGSLSYDKEGNWKKTS
jgi:Schlafen, AlbA_2